MKKTAPVFTDGFYMQVSIDFRIIPSDSHRAMNWAEKRCWK